MSIRPHLAALAVFLLLPLAGWAETLTILHVNDFHGALLPVAGSDGRAGEGGAARLAALVKAERTPTTLFLASGDLLKGTPLAEVFGGRPVIEVFNLMGLDASAVGNHEFDYGQARFAELAGEAAFPFLAANIDGGGAWRPSLMRTVGTQRIALFALTTQETPRYAAPEVIAGLAFTDPVAAARRMVAELRPQADLIILLSHLGIDIDRQLAAAVPGIDIIVGGHSHTRIVQPETVGQTLIVQDFERGRVLGRLDLDVEGGKVAGCRYRPIPVAGEGGEDPAVAAIVSRYEKLLAADKGGR